MKTNPICGKMPKKALISLGLLVMLALLVIAFYRPLLQQAGLPMGQRAKNRWRDR